MTLRAAALSFVLAHPDVTVVIVGMAAPDEVDDNLKAARTGVPDDLWTELRESGLLGTTTIEERSRMKIDSVRAVLTGHRILNPEMQRSWALVRIETDSGTVGWGEASTNWGHSYPTVFRTVVEDVCSRHLEGRDPLAIRDRVGDLKVALDGYLGWEGLSSQTIGAIEIALWDILGKTLGAPIHQLLGGRAYPIPLYGTGTTMFEQSHDWHAHYFDQCVGLGFKGVKVRLGRAVDEDVELVRLVRGPRRTRPVDRRGLLLVPRRRQRHRARHADRSVPHPLLRGADPAVPDRRARTPAAQLAHPGGGRRARLLRSGLRRAGRPRRGSGLRTGRHAERRSHVLHGGRRHRRPLLDRGHPPHRRSDRGRVWRPTSSGPRRLGSDCSSSTSSAISR